MADQGGTKNSLTRDYRKGNWTIQETMVLIEAKKMDDERRMKRSSEDHSEIGAGAPSSSSNSGVMRNKPTELRWKWVEDYCWRKGCYRSQNQCNDKWDNLMRDYKKVRDYEITRRNLVLVVNGDRTRTEKNDDEGCYWKIEKNERKAKNLPSNMLHQIYDALVEVVERKGCLSSLLSVQRLTQFGGGSGGGGSSEIEARPISMVSPIMQQQPLQLPPPPRPPVAQPQPQPQLPPPLPLPTPMRESSSESDTSEYPESASASAKRRRKDGGGDKVCSAVSKNASIIAQAIKACDDKKQTRHKEILILQEKILQIQESNKQGFSGLVDAINNLANSLLVLANAPRDNNNNQTPPN